MNAARDPATSPRHMLGKPFPGFGRWLHSHSVRVRLYSVFALLFLLVIGLGIVGFVRLSDVNHASEVIRNHWLRDTRNLGDLSNYMSDFRAAEASRLLAATPLQFAASDKDIETLRVTVAASEHAYEEIAQDPSEAKLYDEFVKQWAAYQRVAVRVIDLAQTGRTADAVNLYNTDSRRAFDQSSDILARLTEQTVVKAREDSDRAASTYRHARAMLVTAMLLAVILLFGVIMYITRGILAPLLKLVACMHKLAGNDIEITIPGVQRDDEIGAMARAVSVFRDNAVALADSQRRLIEQAAALEEGLEHERRLTAQQRDFVSMTSHEFLTPLTIIDGHAQRLIKMSDRLDAGDITERGSSIRTAVHRITGIMDSLLGASRILDGPAVFHPSEIDPGGVLREACQAHRDATHRVAITEDIAPLPSMIHGDSKLLFHAFSNLISNAIKYSPSGSTVEVTARQESEWLVVQVRDSGIGIPARDREHLFERYFRGSNATGIAGTGVGLHLVSMVVALHHGEVFAESLEGVGSRFTVRLPSLCSAFFGAILSVVGFGAMSARAENADAPADARLDTIVVTAKKHPEPAADEQVKRQVETALHSDPFFYDEHVSVTIINGVVTLHGIVFDDWDLRIAMRIAKRMPGVKRVVNDLEIKMGGE